MQGNKNIAVGEILESIIFIFEQAFSTFWKAGSVHGASLQMALSFPMLKMQRCPIHIIDVNIQI